MTSAPRATPCLAADDSLRIETAPDGEERFFRADGSVEYTYARPFILELEITRRCNLRCLHCYAHAGSESANELSRAEIRGFLDQARALGIDELSLTGGEATLHPDFVGIIDDALERGFHVRFVTNGTLFDRPLLRALCARPIKLITISLDGVSPEAHERIRGPGSHAKTMRAIDELQAAGFALSLITAFSKLNVGELDALLGFCVSRGLDWQVQMTSAKGRCVGGLLNLFVRANGEVTPCSAMAFPGCAVGNLHRERLADICGEARCRKLLEERFGKLSGVCASCPFGHACRGGCPDILYSMCERPTENEYCFYRLEQQELLAAACPNRSEE